MSDDESGVMGPVVTPEHVQIIVDLIDDVEFLMPHMERDHHCIHATIGLPRVRERLSRARKLAARSAPAVPTGRESASQDVAHRDTREGLERSATELREQAEADAKRIFGGRSTTRDRE